MIWLLIAVIASLTVLLLVLPVLRGAVTESSDGLGAFAGQMAELRRDRELGLIEESEARAAEMDIKRRLLAASAQRDAAAGELTGRSETLRRVIILAAGGTAMLAVLVYILIGRPELAGARPPEPATMPAEMAEVMAEIDALAADLMANPDNPRGWMVLGEAYSALGRFAEAVVAFENAVARSEAPTANLFASLGQAHLFAADGDMTPAAREAFARALELDAGNVRARFFMAEAQHQEGERAAALAGWRALLADTPADAPYRPMIEARIAAVSGEEGEAGPDDR